MSRRLTNVDGLRGLAAVLVIIGHWSEFVAAHSPGTLTSEILHDIFLKYFSAGRTGIVAFFCISGFVIPFSFRGENPKINFLISRFFRLYPAYWVSMICGMLSIYLLSGFRFPYWDIAANITMLPALLKAIPIIGVYWTLHIEIFFYASCFLIFWAGYIHSAKANFILMVVWLCLGLLGGGYRFFHPESSLPIGIPTYLAAMHFGTLARIKILEENEPSSNLLKAALLLLLTAVITSNTAGYIASHTEIVGWVAANTGYVAGIILFLLCIWKNFFAGKIMAYVGLISYSLYLFHTPSIQIFEYFWPKFSSWQLAACVGTFFVFSASFLIASLVQKFVEKPMIGVARKLERTFDRSIRGANVLKQGRER